MSEEKEPFKIDMENPINKLAVCTAVHSLEFLLPIFKRAADEEEDYFEKDVKLIEYEAMLTVLDQLRPLKQEIDENNY